MPRWTQDDIPWEAFEPGRLSQDLLALAKAAALTEYNAAQYTRTLRKVFSGDDAFARLVGDWQVEEEQHGAVLGRYGAMADPSFDFERSFRLFRDGYVLPGGGDQSVRGSRAGELLARCVVETGTSSFYTAMGEATGEPVLKAICHRIAGDEYRHYRMFLEALRRYQPREGLSLPARIRVVVGRIRETDDDELAFAYHCANESDRPYDRDRCNRLYSVSAYGLYRYHHARKVVGMTFKAAGLNPQSRLSEWTSRWAWRKMGRRASVPLSG
ncbi:MAG: ferritin-like domain-containing protein [Telmatospirillum sp.]|nr:ferritin-like domain-containing protein [Telmatospirillum sp.]